MAGPSDDYLSRIQDYKQRLENLLVEAQGSIDRQAPDVLDKMAATARNIALRLDDMASDARQRSQDTEATPEPAIPEPASGSGESGTEPLEPEEALAEDAATEFDEPSGR